MPKERVHTLGTFEPAVGWSKDGCQVQVGVGIHDGRSLFWQLLGRDDEALEQLGLALINRFHGLVPGGTVWVGDDGKREGLIAVARGLLDALDVIGSDPGGSDYAGIWADLNRQAINDLIRLLRKARDQAYGRDE